MEAKRIEISTLLRVGFKKTENLKQLTVSRRAVHQVEQRLKTAESVKDRSQSGKPQVISQVVIKKGIRKLPIPENDKIITENFQSLLYPA